MTWQQTRSAAEHAEARARAWKRAAGAAAAMARDLATRDAVTPHARLRWELAAKRLRAIGERTEGA